MHHPGDVLELFERALAADPNDDDEGPYWNAVSALRLSRDPCVLSRALELSRDARARARALSANVLGQLSAGSDPPPVVPEAVDALRRLLDDAAEEVLVATLHALGHTPDEPSLPRIIAYAKDPRPDVRLAAACALGAYAEDAEAIAALVHASADTSARVRDWATFALGSLTDHDSPALREALLARTEDEDDATRVEAVTGLALRHDGRAVPGLARVFAENEVKSALVPELLEAARVLADADLVPALLAFRGKSEAEEWPLIDSVITACRKKRN